MTGFSLNPIPSGFIAFIIIPIKDAAAIMIIALIIILDIELI